MKPSNELFVLIKSLTKSEKRFFKLSSSMQNGEKNYIKIFDYIDAQETYDEYQMKDFFKGETFIKHLPSEKNHLYKLILKSLRAFYSEQTVSSQLKEELKNIEILYNKALYKECSKFLKRAKKLAWEYEKFYYLIELIAWEKQLIEDAYQDGDFSVDLSALILEEAEIVGKLQNLATYHVLYSEINAIFRSGGFSKNEAERKQVDTIANHPLIKGKNTALSVRAATICYYIQGLCAATNRDYKSSYQKFNKTKEIIDKNPKLKKDLGQRYILTLSHLLNCYKDERDFEMVQSVIFDLNNLRNDKSFQSLDLKIKLFGICFNEQIYLYNQLGEYQKAIDYFDATNMNQQNLINSFNKEQSIVMHFNMANAYFGNTDFKNALKCINEIINDNESNLRQDIYSFSRILNIFIHFELGNFDYLDYTMKSTSRFFKKTQKDYHFEKVIIQNISKLIRAEDSETRSNLYEAFAKDVDELLMQPEEKVILTYFNLPDWLKRKLE